MRCMNCNRDIPDNTKFCPFCGEKVYIPAPNNQNFKTCAFCGTQIEVEKDFCHSCGHRFIEELTPADKKAYAERTVRKKKGNGLLVALIIILILAIAGVAAWVIVNKLGSEDTESEETVIQDETVEDDEEEQENILLLSIDSHDYEVEEQFYTISGTASVTKEDGVIKINGEKIIDVTPDEEKVSWSVEVELLVGRNDFKVELSDDDGNKRTKTVTITRKATEEDEFLFESDKYYISDYDLYGKTQEEVALIRNEIYARHGYIFSTEEYAEYFSEKSWYVPNPYFSEELFNEIEKANKDFIVQYETDRGWR